MIAITRRRQRVSKSWRQALRLRTGQVIVGDVLLDAAAQALQQRINAVDLGLELQAEADAAARLLPLEIDAGPVMPRAPRAGGLGAVTLDFARLAELASGDTKSD